MSGQIFIQKKAQIKVRLAALGDKTGQGGAKGFWCRTLQGILSRLAGKLQHSCWMRPVAGYHHRCSGERPRSYTSHASRLLSTQYRHCFFLLVQEMMCLSTKSFGCCSVASFASSHSSHIWSVHFACKFQFK